MSSAHMVVSSARRLASDTAFDATRSVAHAGHGPVLAAFDGRIGHDGIMVATKYAAARLGATPIVVAACEPVMLEAVGFEPSPFSMEFNAHRTEALRKQVTESLGRVPNGGDDWRAVVSLGSIPDVLARTAEELNASLIVMGAGHHSAVDRVMGRESTLATMRRATVPVLALRPDIDARSTAHFLAPSRVVAGCDFSPASVRAARVALSLIGTGGRLTLVHVQPARVERWSDWKELELEYNAALPSLFEKFLEQLGPTPNVSTDTVVVRGEPAETLVTFAQHVGADLIAVGTERHSLFDRLTVGSVATHVLRHAHADVLVAPPPRFSLLSDLVLDNGIVEESSKCSEWSSMLDTFTRANRGRNVRAEVATRQWHVRKQQNDATFGGATYEANTGRVELFFEGPGDQSHLSHAYRDTKSIAIVRDRDASALALVVTHAGGSFVVRFLA